MTARAPGASTIDIDLDRFRALERSWTAARAARRIAVVAEWKRSLDQMRTTQASIVAADGWTAGPTSLMSVLGLTRNEVANCRVVRWILDPLSRHGLGTSMVTSIGEAIGQRPSNPEQVVVEAEVTRDETRADLFLWSPADDWSVVVEAKVDAGEQWAQARRLEDNFPEANGFVFLTVGGERRPGTTESPERWTPMGWDWLAETALGHLAVATSTRKAERLEARLSVEAWARSLRRSLR
jgi:hypothetical protein